MTRIEFAPAVKRDIDRILDHLMRHDAANIEVRLATLFRAIDVLEHSPLIGRLADGDSSELRELVVGQGAHGYRVLYQHFAALGVVQVAAIRAQREQRYSN